MIESSIQNVEKVKETSDKPTSFFEMLEDKINPTMPELLQKKEAVSNWWGELENDEYPSTYEDRINQTPKEISDRGIWTGERGESKYIPTDKEILEILAKYGLNGIEYRDGIPDFSGCSEATVTIDNMSENRYGKGGNFEQCDQKCADQWNKEGRDGKNDWTARDVANWRKENGYTWHERNDMKTCDLIPTKINDYFGHLGGVGECKRRDDENSKDGGFDE